MLNSDAGLLLIVCLGPSENVNFDGLRLRLILMHAWCMFGLYQASFDQWRESGGEGKEQPTQK